MFLIYKMKKTIKGFCFVLVLSLVVLSGCTAVTPEKYKKLDEYITDIEIDEVQNGLIMNFKTKGGGSFAIAIPDKEGCSAAFGKEINYIFCGFEEAAQALPAEPALE